jgi:hypothetical protein
MPRVSARRIEKLRAQVLPLDEFPAAHREHILTLVAQPDPPNKWIALGPEDSAYPLAWIPSRAWAEWHWARGIDPNGSRPPIPKALRQQVIDRDGYVCQLCLGDVEPSDVHLDHIRPWSKGGPHTLDNLQVTHSLCNIIKGARDV